MSILIAIVLGVAALAFALFPLYRGIFTRAPAVQGAATENGSEGTAGVRTEREQSARTALQEIELDYQLGNISQEDYNTLRERYMRRALVALKSRHEQGQNNEQHYDYKQEHNREQELDDLIEEQLRKMKESGNDATE